MAVGAAVVVLGCSSTNDSYSTGNGQSARSLSQMLHVNGTLQVVFVVLLMLRQLHESGVVRPHAQHSLVKLYDATCRITLMYRYSFMAS